MTTQTIGNSTIEIPFDTVRAKTAELVEEADRVMRDNRIIFGPRCIEVIGPAIGHVGGLDQIHFRDGESDAAE